MNPETPLGDLLGRLRAGDPAAAAEVVRRYETAIRVAVRARLTDPALRRQFDSMDVCQSVFLSFYVRASAGQYELDRPEDLVGLLVRMALNKLASQARYHRRERRPGRTPYTRGMATTAIERKLPIAGEWIETGEWVEVASPYDGTTVGRIARGWSSPP